MAQACIPVHVSVQQPAQASLSLSIQILDMLLIYHVNNIIAERHNSPEGVVASIAVIIVFIRGCFVPLLFLFLLHLSAERLCAAALHLMSSRRVSGDRCPPLVLPRALLASVAHVRGYNQADRRVVSVMFLPFHRALIAARRIEPDAACQAFRAARALRNERGDTQMHRGTVYSIINSLLALF